MKSDDPFSKSKYTKWYFNIINHRRKFPPIGYTENHHIIPSSLGGNDLDENLIKLTAREHFICHLLLTKMTNGMAKQKMIWAAISLSTYRNENREKIKINSHTYQFLRDAISQIARDTMKNKWYKLTPEQRSEKIRYVNNKRWENATLEDRQYIANCMKDGWIGKSRSNVVKNNWDNLSVEERAHKSRGISKSWDNLSVEKRSQRARKASLIALEKSKAFRYICTNPEGEKFDIKGLGVFCKEMNLDKNMMRKVSSGRALHYNLWTCYRVDEHGNPIIPKPFIKKKTGPKLKK